MHNNGDLKNEILHDRIIVGLRDGAITELLQMDPGLTLETAKKRVRQKEAVKDQSKQLRGKKKLQPLVRTR